MAHDLAMHEWAEEHRAHIQRILKVNADLEERARLLGTSQEYDREEDCWRILIGDRVPALTESVDDTFRLRVEPRSLKIVGIEVAGLTSIFAGGDASQWLFQRLLSLAVAHNHRRRTEPQSSSVTGDLYRLVTAGREQRLV